MEPYITTEKIAQTFVDLLKLAVTPDQFKIIQEYPVKINIITNGQAPEIMEQAFSVNDMVYNSDDHEELYNNAWDRAKEIMQEGTKKVSPPAKNERLIKALRNFEIAYRELDSAWSESNYHSVTNEPLEPSPSLNNNYPFELSFDDYGNSIQNWVENSINDLSK